MIVLLIVLWSICAIYFTHLLFKKHMKIAASMVAVLYSYVLVWIYLLFFVDVAGVGFNLTAQRGDSILYGIVYRSFSAVSIRMSDFSDADLTSIILIGLLILFASLSVVVIGTFRISKEIIRIICSLKQPFYITSAQLKSEHKIDCVAGKKIPLIKLYCRANC